MSAKTLDVHYGKHHAAYVKKLNELLKGSPLATQSLEQVIQATCKDPQQGAVFNNAAQSWNHDFFWQCMKRGGGGAPNGALATRITSAFGSIDGFKEDLQTAAVGQFGSGWAWLVVDGRTLKIVTTGNADNPLAHGQTALLVVDVWEHAYYLDYQNRRPDFVQTFLDKLVNWDFVAGNLEKLTLEESQGAHA